MNKIRVCFIVTDAISFNVLCKGQLEYFKDQGGFDISLICGGDVIEILKLERRNVGNIHNCYFKRRPSLIRDILSFCNIFFFFLFNRYDLVVYSTPKALLIASIAACLTRQKRRIAMYRGRAYENSSGLKLHIFLLLERITIACSHRAIFISDSLREKFIEQHLIAAHKTDLIGFGSSNGVDSTKFLKCRIDLKEKNRCKFKAGYSSNDIIVLILGRICYDKGIEDIAEIITKSSNKKLKFLLVGAIEDSTSIKIVDYLIENYYNIQYIPHVDDISCYLSIADIHLFLSHREGFGNVAIEAAASGLPTIAYNVIGVKDSVADNISGLRFEYRDTNSIIDCLNIASNDFSRFLSNFENMGDWVLEKFDQKTVWQNYYKYYFKQATKIL